MIIQYYAEIAFCVNLIKFMIVKINNNASSVFQGRARSNVSTSDPISVPRDHFILQVAITYLIFHNMMKNKCNILKNG